MKELNFTSFFSFLYYLLENIDRYWCALLSIYSDFIPSLTNLRWLSERIKLYTLFQYFTWLTRNYWQILMCFTFQILRHLVPLTNLRWLFVRNTERIKLYGLFLYLIWLTRKYWQILMCFAFQILRVFIFLTYLQLLNLWSLSVRIAKRIRLNTFFLYSTWFTGKYW